MDGSLKRKKEQMAVTVPEEMADRDTLLKEGAILGKIFTSNLLERKNRFIKDVILVDIATVKTGKPKAKIITEF
jgi:hypothetical protein